MANEFVHVTVGTALTQAEYELITAHQFNSQATGDTLYASSATQLSRLAIGTGVLYASGGVPTWSAAPVLTSPTIQGTVLAGTGLTMPAFTLGGDMSAGGYVISNFHQINSLDSVIVLVVECQTCHPTEECGCFRSIVEHIWHVVIPHHRSPSGVRKGLRVNGDGRTR